MEKANEFYLVLLLIMSVLVLIGVMSWFPVYEYIVNGTVKRNQAFAGTAKPEVPIGQKVALYVNPERPDEFYCPDEKKVPVQKVFAGVGVLCVSIAVILGVVLCIN